MGCYPLFSCQDWPGLQADIDDLESELVSVALVTDPFGCYAAGDLRACFPDRVVPFKQHFVADVSVPAKAFVSRHHRYYAQRALKTVQVERCAQPIAFVDDWITLYAALVERHRLTGIKALSPHALAAQLEVPGLVMLRASVEGATVAAHLWYVQDDVAQSHLAATSARGYELMAPYALAWLALETFAGDVRWVNFGAGAGVTADTTSGLSRFKKGWANQTRTSYFCGRIFDRTAYGEALARSGHPDSGYFPAYRRGELA